MRPLRVYLLILILSAVLPGVIVTSVLVWRASATNRDVSERRLIESARVDASALDRTFEATVTTLQALATSPTLDNDNLQAFYTEARRIQQTQPDWYTVLLLSPDNRPLLSTRLPQGGVVPAESEAASLERGMSAGGAAVGPLRTAPGGGSELLFPVRVPVMRNGRLTYAVSAILNVAALTRVVPQQTTESDEWTRILLDPDGTIAVRTRGAGGYVGGQATEGFRARLRQLPEGISRETTREGIPVYAASSRGQYGWTAVVVVPSTLLDRPLRLSIAGVAAGATLFLVCGLAGVLIVSRRLSADISAAAAAAKTLADGRPLRPAPAYVVETGELQKSLVSAASLLAQREQERDAEIQRADAARDDAEQANRAKDEFLAVLGHELRNPLAPALTALELMRARDSNVFARERQVLERQVAHMTRLVNDLLDVSRLSRGKVQLTRKPFELKEAVDRAVDMAAPLIAGQDHTLTVSVPDHGLTIDGDIDRIVQVISNLLTNAARYTPPRGHIALTASADDRQVHIVCEDDGPGVAPDLVPKLFKPFVQGPRAIDRREGGLGLGLALASTFTELHGGTLEYQRVETGGSRFVVVLPLATNKRDDTAPPASPASYARRRILLVDDNSDARVMLQAALESAGHVVAVAATGAEALTSAAGFRPDTAVLDIGLPGMDGYELARRMRSAYPEVRLIALTGFGQASDVTAAHAAGFDAHCAKPITVAALLDTIEEAARKPVDAS